MSEEKKKILEMVSDGTITPSEGARLLEALSASGGFMREGRRPSGRKPVVEARAILAEVGPMIQETIGDMFGGKRKTGSDLSGIEFTEYESYTRETEEGHEVVIHGRMKKGYGLTLNLTGTSGNTLSAVIDDDDSMVSAFEKPGKTILLWKHGELEVNVPDTVTELKVVTQGGSIHSERLSASQKLNTMGGSVTILDPGDSFTAKTMGGSLVIRLDERWHANSKAKSMGGGISVILPDDIDVDVAASTLGGSIDPGSQEHTVVSSSDGRRGGAKMTLRYGTDDSPPKLAVSTMGGNISIGSSEDE